MKESDYLDDLGIDERVWNGFIWLRIGAL